jgi:AcrR family transcriptional regulator
MSTESSRDDPREAEILRAAFAVFTEKGFHVATMLDVASRAHASKATLYARFANKQALFQALVAWGVRQGTEALGAIAGDRSLDPLTALNRFAARLLAQMLQPEKLALFRIAVAEGERMPEVGKTYSRLTRDHGVELGRRLAARLVEDGIIEIGAAEDFGHSFIGLLQGELFTRALLGAIPPPSDAEIEAHARRAMRRLVRAFAPA